MPKRAVHPLEGGATALEPTRAGAGREVVAERVEHRLAMPKARASTDAAREREAGPTAQHDVEALILHILRHLQFFF